MERGTRTMHIVLMRRPNSKEALDEIAQALQITWKEPYDEIALEF